MLAQSDAHHDAVLHSGLCSSLAGGEGGGAAGVVSFDGCSGLKNKKKGGHPNVAGSRFCCGLGGVRVARVPSAGSYRSVCLDRPTCCASWSNVLLTASASVRL